jgi:hypothetical protein
MSAGGRAWHGPSRALESAAIGASAWLALIVLGLAGCSPSPPPSQFPTANSAIERMRASHACSRGVTGEAKLDYFGESGRVRGSLLYIASLPDRVRLDVVSPFGATLSTLTSDGTHFSLLDLQQKSFTRGPANTCNLERFTRVPLPPHAFAELLRGDAPVLVHSPSDATIAWEQGAYTIEIRGRDQAVEEIRLVPLETDFQQLWSAQRVRVLRVGVRQAGVPLYRVDLADHAAAPMSAPRVDPEGIDPPVPPSGPVCEAEVPRRLHFVTGDGDKDVLLVSHDIRHNPPLPEGVFEQPVPGGVTLRDSPCR